MLSVLRCKRSDWLPLCFIAPGASRPLHYCSFLPEKKSSPSIFRRTQGGRGASRGPRWCKRQRKRTRRSRARGLLLAWPCPRCAHVAPTWHPVDIPRIAISLLLLVRFQKFLRQQDPLDALSLHCPCPPERKKKKSKGASPAGRSRSRRGLSSPRPDLRNGRSDRQTDCTS